MTAVKIIQEVSVFNNNDLQKYLSLHCLKILNGEKVDAVERHSALITDIYRSKTKISVDDCYAF